MKPPGDTEVARGGAATGRPSDVRGARYFSEMMVV
jgi:hypothetical protein